MSIGDLSLYKAYGKLSKHIENTEKALGKALSDKNPRLQEACTEQLNILKKTLENAPSALSEQAKRVITVLDTQLAELAILKKPIDRELVLTFSGRLHQFSTEFSGKHTDIGLRAMGKVDKNEEQVTQAETERKQATDSLDAGQDSIRAGYDELMRMFNASRPMPTVTAEKAEEPKEPHKGVVKSAKTSRAVQDAGLVAPAKTKARSVSFGAGDASKARGASTGAKARSKSDTATVSGGGSAAKRGSVVAQKKLPGAAATAKSDVKASHSESRRERSKSMSFGAVKSGPPAGKRPKSAAKEPPPDKKT